MIAVGSPTQAHLHLQPSQTAEPSLVSQATPVVCEAMRDRCASSDLSTSPASRWARAAAGDTSGHRTSGLPGLRPAVPARHLHDAPLHAGARQHELPRS